MTDLKQINGKFELDGVQYYENVDVEINRHIYRNAIYLGMVTVRTDGTSHAVPFVPGKPPVIIDFPHFVDAVRYLESQQPAT